jgi:hypothetical protein
MRDLESNCYPVPDLTAGLSSPAVSDFGITNSLWVNDQSTTNNNPFTTSTIHQHVIRPPPGLVRGPERPDNVFDSSPVPFENSRPPYASADTTDNFLQGNFMNQNTSNPSSPFLSPIIESGDTSKDTISVDSLLYRAQYPLKENPFADIDDDDDEMRIEAELQVLGGQIVGSLLD